MSLICLVSLVVSLVLSSQFSSLIMHLLTRCYLRRCYGYGYKHWFGVRYYSVSSVNIVDSMFEFSKIKYYEKYHEKSSHHQPYFSWLNDVNEKKLVDPYILYNRGDRSDSLIDVNYQLPLLPESRSYSIFYLCDGELVDDIKQYYFPGSDIDVGKIKQSLNELHSHGDSLIKSQLSPSAIEKFYSSCTYMYKLTFFDDIVKDNNWKVLLKNVDKKKVVIQYIGLAERLGVDVNHWLLNIMNEYLDNNELLPKGKMFLDYKYRIKLPIEQLPENVSSKLFPNDTLDSNYYDEMYKLGELVLRSVPLLYRMINAPLLDKRHDSLGIEHITKVISKSKDFQNLESSFNSKDITFTIYHLLGISFLINPTICMKRLTGIYSGHKQESFHHTLNQVTSFVALNNGPLLDLNRRFLHYEENQFLLPAIKDSVASRFLLINNCIINTPESPSWLQRPDLKVVLDNSQAYGNTVYKLYLRYSILKHSLGNFYKRIYTLLNSDSYKQWMVDNIHVFDHIIQDLEIMDVLKLSGNGGLYSHQFDQYFSVLLFQDTAKALNWVESGVQQYVDMFDSLSKDEATEVVKHFRAKLHQHQGYIGDQYLKKLQTSFVPVINQESKLDSDSLKLISYMAYNAVNYYIYKFWLYNDYGTFVRKRKLVKDAIDKFDVQHKLYQSFGLQLIQDKDKGHKQIIDYLSNLLDKKYVDLDKSKLPITEDIELLVFECQNITSDIVPSQLPNLPPSTDRLQKTIAVNYHVSLDYFRSLNITYKTITKLADHCRKLRFIGSAYYRYRIITTIIDQKIPPILANDIIQVMNTKVFKTFIWETSGLLFSTNDATYNHLISQRLVTSYSKCKLGQTGFDQLMALYAFNDPGKLDPFFDSFVTYLNSPGKVNSFRQHLDSWLRKRTHLRTLLPH